MPDIPNALQKNKTESEIYKEVYNDEVEEIYVESIMKELAPKLKIMPDVPYKTIFGVTKPENVEGISEKWKEKFKTTYGHVILEDTSIQDQKKSVKETNKVDKQEIETKEIRNEEEKKL